MTNVELIHAIDELYFDATQIFRNEWDEVFVLAMDRNGMKVTSKLCQSPVGCELAAEFIKRRLNNVDLPYVEA